MPRNSYLIRIILCRIPIVSQIIRFIGKVDTCSLGRNVNITINLKITCWRSSIVISYLNFIQATTVICQVYINTKLFFTINNNLMWISAVDLCILNRG